MNLVGFAIDCVERGWVPDLATRAAIRRLCSQRLGECQQSNCELEREDLESFLSDMRRGPIAPVPERANEQHYELPASFFGHVLGPHRKYSCCWWPAGVDSLEAAEAASLGETCARAELADGQEILELGCGWGSLSLWMASRYPGSRVTAVSNSRPQREYIESEARRRGIENLQVITADMNRLHFNRSFDRVVSVEMFEHMRNYERLLRRISGWLRPEGRLFVHIFCHRRFAYPFETDGDDNWMGRYFFTGGIMPSDDLLARFSDDLRVERQWRWNGQHYQRTSDAWLHNLDRNRDQVMPILEEAYGRAESHRWFHRWRMFFLAVSELFGYRGGEEWFVGHYLLRPRSEVPAGGQDPSFWRESASTN
jgi:cyclopropane-fatty-acyl-phospholipid synthase